MSTGTMIDDVLQRCGLDTTPTHVTRPQIAMWLNEAQRALCSEGRLLATIWRGKSQANAELYQLPGEFYQIVKVEIRDVAKNVYKTLIGGSPYDRPARRDSVDGDFPSRFGIWGANDLAGTTDNKPALFFDKNFGHTSADYNFYIWARQKPKTMVDAGQGPEVQEYWQDGMKDYAEWRLRGRLSMSNRDEVALARMAKDSWMVYLSKSADFRYDAMHTATYPRDDAGYVSGSEGEVTV